MENPFLHPYHTPHDTVPFDKITLADYEPAIREGMRREDEEIKQIIIIHISASLECKNNLDQKSRRELKK